MTFKKVAYKLHLWLGLISGIIVFIVCITGAIWALRINGWVGDTAKDEIECLPTQQNQKLLLPSQLVAEASAELGTTTPNNINYTKDKSTSIAVWGKNYKSVDINPYTGKLIEDTDSATVSSDSFNFWRFIGSGHRSLWLPWEIGRPIVNYGTLLFVIVLITGLIIWFPKSKKAAKNRLWFNWKKNTPAKRKIIDLHHVVGFYSCFLLLVIAFTGMVWGIQWWSKGLYSLTTGGKELPAWGAAKSDTTYVDTSINLHDAIDEVFVKLVEENPKAYSISINYPDTINKTSVIKATISKRKGGYYDSDYYDFDRYTLQPIAVVGPYSGKYEDASFGDKLRRMNYEIHIGSIAGTPGRILVFFAAIFGASLPVTGVYIFFKTRKKRKSR